MGIYITGDTHGDIYERFGRNAFPEGKYMEREDQNYVIVCGDFGGVWSGSVKEERELDRLEEELPFTLLWVDGNHENYDLLGDYEKFPYKEWGQGKVQQIRPHILHLMRGEVYLIEGKTFFTFGGARSHDISDGILDGRQEPEYLKAQIMAKIMKGKNMWRIDHMTWWKEELPDQETMERAIKNLEQHQWKVDYVITHCLPTNAQAYFSAGRFQSDILTDFLQKLEDRGLSYKKWFCGHYHCNEMLDDRHQILYKDIQRIC